MKLSRLLKAVDVVRLSAPGFPVPDPEIRSLHYRSQTVQPGGLFIAVPGFRADGHAFIDDAIRRGAAAVVTQQPVSCDAVVAEVADSRRALGRLASRFYGEPSKQLVLIAITGTNGKTTTSYLIEQILTSAGYRVGVIGTIGYRYGGKTFETPVTTPESLDLQRILADMDRDGVSHVVMEASSHAIDLHRLAGCEVDVAVFTNLSQDHLDYHLDMDRYWACKERLFTEILARGAKRNRAVAVVNGNDPRGRLLSEKLTVPCFTAGESDGNMIWSPDFRFSLAGITGRIVTPEGNFSFTSPMTGRHNLENILCAVGVGAALHIPFSAMEQGIEVLTAVPGRLEAVPDRQGRFVYVDYAHTPDALANVLSALKPLVTPAARIICVFGCGGDRDRDKRPRMGEIAGRFSDLAVITSDNPRTEEPLAIIRQIVTGASRAGGRFYRPGELRETGSADKGYVVEPDRRKAIRLAVAVSRPGDVVLIAGKGHETYQIIGSGTIPFDDRAEARQALDEYEADSLDNTGGS